MIITDHINIDHMINYRSHDHIPSVHASYTVAPNGHSCHGDAVNGILRTTG